MGALAAERRLYLFLDFRPFERLLYAPRGASCQLTGELPQWRAL